MPLSRYQLRSAYSLGNPELYQAENKDDSEAVFEGVTMAGLTGVLRQLGDLAEFAAEVFRDLHEEVMATAARGHGLMLRVGQMDSVFPSIETAFLSRTDHSAFFHNTGLEWHPNSPTERNPITRKPPPRFIMDYIEECRAPPELNLLDRFDVAGAGACLKRYTDPSIFSVEIPRSRTPKPKKSSANKKSQRPKVLVSVKDDEAAAAGVVTSHTKLRELLSEERAQNERSGTGRRAKLKKKHHHPGHRPESYMERFIEDHDLVRDISMLPLLPGRALPVIEESEMPVDQVKGLFGHYEDGPPHEKELTVVGESGLRSSLDDDDMLSHVDDYADALATMDPDADLAAGSVWSSDERVDRTVRVQSDTPLPPLPPLQWRIGKPACPSDDVAGAGPTAAGSSQQERDVAFAGSSAVQADDDDAGLLSNRAVGPGSNDVASECENGGHGGTAVIVMNGGGDVAVVGHGDDVAGDPGVASGCEAGVAAGGLGDVAGAVVLSMSDDVALDVDCGDVQLGAHDDNDHVRVPEEMVSAATLPVFRDKPSRLPKTRHPLMEAVAARDKSKLRKAAERVRPALARKLDEKDSMLEQIRTGSFNLRRTPTMRPNVHGPNRTNLKVVAIVEKASAMRHAIAGSDEDSDRWSDDS